ncbi:hypothetical protein RO3G_17199 [Rhizopus delemar RA 99-880]|uniref:Uncharacterized protein n=1 Tax=Rhizopus delemar (strain RA 99-880 / ATCC MYA-4621 / FGSC 9543 / NRRL 43880) TaxID=246409 RepID=I1CV48_RHIO9|nr:hypothetical protein RO3G_17199 [Rhizopus delemar RA 99-880]|eukprot:EIE92328.1 hypothetical protein RO3G_17199 [Rhizopus delemar RA 99-880]
MWSLLKRRLNDYETAPKGMNELYERCHKIVPMHRLFFSSSISVGAVLI